MPYENNKDLPEPLKNVLPKGAQTIYRETFNSAWKTYKFPGNRRNPNEPLDSVCRKVAWSAVKEKYEKGEDDTWHLK